MVMLAPAPPAQVCLSVIESLPTLLRRKRGDKTLAVQAKSIGISLTTMKSLDLGGPPSYATLLKCLAYLTR